jgi:hypothetical protein
LYKEEENMQKRIVLMASEGHVLTDGETYGRIVYLASGNDGEKWYEITEAEYEAKMAELEAHAE